MKQEWGCDVHLLFNITDLSVTKTLPPKTSGCAAVLCMAAFFSSSNTKVVLELVETSDCPHEGLCNCMFSLPMVKPNQKKENIADNVFVEMNSK